MKFTINQSFEEMLETLMTDAGVQPHDESIIRAAMNEYSDELFYGFGEEINSLEHKIAQLTELPDRDQLDNDSLYMDDEGNVYLAGSEEMIGSFDVPDDGATAFNISGDKMAFDHNQIDQLARLKAVWVNQ